MSGGIIIQRAKTLLVAATDPCFYDHLPVSCKDTVDLISAKAPKDLSQYDINALLAMLTVGANT